jgi:eukaryotic-like serine/threonine-protein kinase
LDHLRHLLSGEVKLQRLGLQGGISFWFLKNTATVADLAKSARAAWDTQNTVHLHREIIRLLDYLDGLRVVASDLPPGLDPASYRGLVDTTAASIGLLEFDPQHDDPPGYVYHIASHLQGLDTSPGRSPDQHARALQVEAQLAVVGQELEQVRLDAKRLLPLSTAQLLQPSTVSLLDDLSRQASLAYNGGQVATSGGATLIAAQLQTLATIQVFPYSTR